MLPPKRRRLWKLTSLGVGRQVGITDGFEPNEGYGNWFWGLTPSCLMSLLETAGFKIDFCAKEAFAQTVLCSTVDAPFVHRLPDETEARKMGETISATGRAHPS
jgi:hypothetical protein